MTVLQEDAKSGPELCASCGEWVQLSHLGEDDKWRCEACHVPLLTKAAAQTLAYYTGDLALLDRWYCANMVKE